MSDVVKLGSFSEVISFLEKSYEEKGLGMAKLEEAGLHFAASVLLSLKNILFENSKKLDELDEEKVNIAQTLAALVYTDLIGPLDPDFQHNKQTIDTLNTIMGLILTHFLSPNDEVFLSTGLNLPTGVALLQ